MSEHDQVINFSDLSKEEQQIWVDFALHEEMRHYHDIANSHKERAYIEKHYNIRARHIYVNQWIEITDEKKG